MTVRARVQQLSAGGWKSSQDVDQPRKNRPSPETRKKLGRAPNGPREGSFPMILSVRSRLSPPGFTLIQQLFLKIEKKPAFTGPQTSVLSRKALIKHKSLITELILVNYRCYYYTQGFLTGFLIVCSVAASHRQQ